MTCPMCDREYTDRTVVGGVGESISVPTTSEICVDPIREGASAKAVVYEHDKIEIELADVDV